MNGACSPHALENLAHAPLDSRRRPAKRAWSGGGELHALGATGRHAARVPRAPVVPRLPHPPARTQAELRCARRRGAPAGEASPLCVWRHIRAFEGSPPAPTAPAPCRPGRPPPRPSRDPPPQPLIRDMGTQQDAGPAYCLTLRPSRRVRGWGGRGGGQGRQRLGGGVAGARRSGAHGTPHTPPFHARRSLATRALATMSPGCLQPTLTSPCSRCGGLGGGGGWGAGARAAAGSGGGRAQTRAPRRQPAPQVVPPKGWAPSRKAPDLDNLRIQTPIKQHVRRAASGGGRGVHRGRLGGWAM